MNVAAGPELAAAVTNAGGMGVIGGVGYTPKILRQQVRVLPCIGAYPHPTRVLTSSFFGTDQSYQTGSQGQECAIWC